MKVIQKIKEWEPVFLWRLLMARGWESVVRHLRERKSNHGHVLSTSPPAVLLVWGRDDTSLHQALKEFPLTVLYLFYWDINGGGEDIARSIRRTLEQFPRHRIICLCNEADQPMQFKKFGIEAIFFNHNALVHEGIFRPDDHPAPKKWDAIYNAQLASFKRIELAAHIPSICMVTYRYGGAYDRDYEATVRKAIPQAFWANERMKGGAKLEPAEVAQLLRESHCGLCLSEAEGAMFASMEYLLTGIPVVTTPSRGGRAVFFNEKNTIVCDPDPEAVNQAVMEWKGREVDGRHIRQFVCEEIAGHRTRLVEYLGEKNVRIKFPWFPALSFQKHNLMAQYIIHHI